MFAVLMPVQPLKDYPHEDPDDGPTQSVVERQAVAQPVGHGEHPLPDGHPGQDPVDVIRRLFRHPPPAAARADRPAFTGQRNEALERTVIAANAQKAMDEQTAPEEGAELALNEVGAARPLQYARRPWRGRSPGARGSLRARPCRRQRVGRREPRRAAQRLPCRGSNAAAGRANDIHPGESKTSGRNARRNRTLRGPLTGTARRDPRLRSGRW
jgi:hypothetical protein